MISLAFIVAFIFCLAIAIAGILVSHQLITIYNAAFHRNYFYYLATFYSFAFYGIWGQIIVRAMLSTWNTNIEIIEAVAGFLPILGVPFLLISWIMLLKVAYALFGKEIKSSWIIIHFIFLTLFIMCMWFIVDYFVPERLLINKNLKYVEAGLLISIELVYFLVFMVVVIYNLRSRESPLNKFMLRFMILMMASFVLRGLLLPFSFVNLWVMAPVILFYFVSNLLPLLYIKINAELMFKPIHLENPSEHKMLVIFEKYNISKREREIIVHICEGKTNRQIADDLFISLQTVKDHTHRIYSKIGIKSRMHLVQMVNN
jgi:DNA-binding CsgD family transcriptional regulator